MQQQVRLQDRVVVSDAAVVITSITADLCYAMLATLLLL
jgi:hypothetical protein